MNDWYHIVGERLEEFYTCQKEFVAYQKDKQNKYKYICIFGVGNIGRPTARIMRNNHLRIDYYCDNDKSKWGGEYDGVKCLAVDELLEIKDQTLIYICGRAYKEIFAQLKQLGCPYLDRIFVNKFAVQEYLRNSRKEDVLVKIKRVLDMCEDEQSKKVFSKVILEWLNNESGNIDDIYTGNQYFCSDVLRLENNEVFVDCGAYNGDTLREFLKLKMGNFNKLILFELSQKNYRNLEKNISQLDENIRNRIVLYNKGVSDKDEEIYYEELDEGSSKDNIGAVRGFLTTIDETCKYEKVTYIKMDVEGSEMEALKGAKQCILRNKPKMAICLYHKPEDLWGIPLYIKQILPEYRIFIRHHTDLLNETVCYAVV